MYTYGYGTSCRTADEAEALQRSVALWLRWMVLLKVASRAYYLLPRKAPVFDYSTAYPHPTVSYIYSNICVAHCQLQHLLLSRPIADQQARYSRQPAPPCSSSTRKHLQPQQAIDGYVQHISLNTLSAEPSLVTAKPKHVF
jgi:hypothetical protein